MRNFSQKLNESGRERLLDLVKNPLRLALMCQVWNTIKDLPETQAALYKRFTLYHYDWKQAEFPTTLAQQYELNAALGKLAREAIASGKTRFRIGQNFAYRVMEENLFNRACDLGWLNQVDRDKQTDEPFYAFYHATFQEYFAALAINDWDFFLPREHKDKPVKNEDTGKPKPYRIFEPQWKQVILLWLGREEVKIELKEQFIKALVEFKDNCNNFYKYRAYILAATGIAEFKDCSKADEIVEQIVKWSILPNSLIEIFIIIKSSPFQGVPETQQVQEAAKAVLAKTYRPKAIDALVKLIVKNDSSTHLQAAESLGKIDPGNSDAISALVDLIRNSKDNDTRSDAAESLGKIDPGNSDAINTLIDLIRNSKDNDTRSHAAESLGEIGAGNSDAIRALVDLIRNSKHNYFTRWQAVRSLGKIGAGNSDAISALVDLIRNSEHHGRRYAAESLGEIGAGNSDAIRALVDLIRNSNHDNTRWEAAMSLGKIGAGNSDAIRALVDLTPNSNDNEIRCAAAWNLWKIDPGNSDAISALVDLIGNSNHDNTRGLAACILRKIDPGNSDAINTLIDLIGNSKDNDTCCQAAKSLKDILTVDQMAEVVTTLKYYLLSPLSITMSIFQFKILRYFDCYKVLWDYAQNMPYPDFYQAWHHRRNK